MFSPAFFYEKKVEFDDGGAVIWDANHIFPLCHINCPFVCQSNKLKGFMSSGQTGLGICSRNFTKWTSTWCHWKQFYCSKMTLILVILRSTVAFYLTNDLSVWRKVFIPLCANILFSINFFYFLELFTKRKLIFL